MDAIFLLAGLLALWLGTELTIRGAVAIADRWGLSEFVVGTAILSIGSDLPELSIAVGGSIRSLATGVSSAEIVIGSALGSALGQIGFVLGLVGLLMYLSLPRKTARRHGSVMLGAVGVLGLTLFDGTVSRSEGAILLLVYLTYVVVLLAETSRQRRVEAHEPPQGALRAWLNLTAGLAVVILGAEVTVSSAVGVADLFAVNRGFVAIAIVGLGTSLPELSISLAAAAKKRSGLSIGNLIGSNIFDTLVPVGVAALIVPLQFSAGSFFYDLLFLLLLSAIVLAFLLRKRGLQKAEAAILLGLYVAFLLLRLIGEGSQNSGAA